MMNSNQVQLTSPLNKFRRHMSRILLSMMPWHRGDNFLKKRENIRKQKKTGDKSKKQRAKNRILTFFDFDFL